MVACASACEHVRAGSLTTEKLTPFYQLAHKLANIMHAYNNHSNPTVQERKSQQLYGHWGKSEGSQAADGCMHHIKHALRKKHIP